MQQIEPHEPALGGVEVHHRRQLAEAREAEDGAGSEHECEQQRFAAAVEQVRAQVGPACIGAPGEERDARQRRDPRQQGHGRAGKRYAGDDERDHRQAGDRDQDGASDVGLQSPRDAPAARPHQSGRELVGEPEADEQQIAQHDHRVEQEAEGRGLAVVAVQNADLVDLQVQPPGAVQQPQVEAEAAR